MGKRNRYKDIVFCLLGIAMVFLLATWGEFWMQQQKSFAFIIQADTQLQESVIQELDKIEGLYEFIPFSSCRVTIKLEEYTLDAVVTGIDLERYPLKWKDVQGEISMGNTPLFFWGKDSFSLFVDSYGNSPGKSQISEWMGKYQELQVSAANEKGQTWIGRISGILTMPSEGIYMDRSQMQKIFYQEAATNGGCVKIVGQQNMQNAKDILSAGGFEVREADD